ncbi:MAG: nicotinamide riboside transporter PnuC [Crocinitomicaceae bacterium]|nr:nicotinamide riboside transporter PnuC [Crocinitomicaceae bacterium]
MESFIIDFIQGVYQTTIWEWLAVLCNICYLILAIQQRMACWLFAFLGASIYVYVSYSVHLYLDAFLHFFYVVTAVVGFLNWNKQKDENKIIRWKINYHLINILLTIVLSITLGYLFQKHTPQKSPYLDAFTTCFSLVATFMVAKKVLENWMYWIAIDAVMVYLYFTRDLKLSSILMLIYTILAIKGYFSWRNHYKKQLIG